MARAAPSTPRPRARLRIAVLVTISALLAAPGGAAHAGPGGANAFAGGAKATAAGASVPAAGAMGTATPPIGVAMPPAARMNGTGEAGRGSGPGDAASRPRRPGGGAAPGPPVEPGVPENSSAWEDAFQWGLYYSRQAVDESESLLLSWGYDADGSLSAVPRRMLRAEAMLLEAAHAATPPAKKRERLAEVALRMYYHAKWLAERNYARAAEWRYREASRIAQGAKRSVLAGHALSRLGYFLMHWKRIDEAREVLRTSEQVSTKSNPLAPYLYGVLERQVAGADVARLLAAEERILSAGKQPSDELEMERQDLVSEISFWRAAEGSPRRCLDASDVVKALICGCVHLAVAARRAWFEE